MKLNVTLFATLEMGRAPGPSHIKYREMLNLKFKSAQVF